MQQTSFHAYTTARRLAGLADDEMLLPAFASSAIEIYTFQIAAARFALRSPYLKGCILSDEGSLGKTYEALLIAAQKWYEGKDRLLLILPANLIKQWVAKIETSFTLPYFLCNSGDALPDEDGLAITTYDYAVRHADAIAKKPWDLVTFDEADVLSKPQNKTVSALKTTTGGSFKLLLTPTPITMSIMDIYGLIHFIDESVLPKADDFYKRYFRKPENYPELTSMEQRISRCHRQGQQSDVLVVNLLSKENFADVRILELINKRVSQFDGIFGMSDEIVGNFDTHIDNALSRLREPTTIKAAFDDTLATHESQNKRMVAQAEDTLFTNFTKAVADKVAVTPKYIAAQSAALNEELWQAVSAYFAGRNEYNVDEQEKTITLAVNTPPQLFYYWTGRRNRPYTGQKRYGLGGGFKPSAGRIAFTAVLAKGIFGEIACADYDKIVVDANIESCEIALYDVDIMANRSSVSSRSVLVGRTASGELLDDMQCRMILELPVLSCEESGKTTSYWLHNRADIESFFCNKCALRSSGAICRHVVAGVLAIQGGIAHWERAVRILPVHDNPEYLDRAADYFSAKWPVPRVVYQDSIPNSMHTESPLHRWYLLISNFGEIIGSYGLVANDFTSRQDLWPWLCALYVEESHRGYDYGAKMLAHGRQEARRLGFGKLYLSTGYIGYYEKYGWAYIGVTYSPDGQPSRLYEICTK